jgi:hypothetical protein
LNRTRVRQGREVGGVPYLGADELEAAVFTERGVYRPGEKVMVQALVRDGQMEAPTSFPALFRVRKPDGRVFKDLPVTLDAWGAATDRGGAARFPAHRPLYAGAGPARHLHRARPDRGVAGGFCAAADPGGPGSSRHAPERRANFWRTR